MEQLLIVDVEWGKRHNLLHISCGTCYTMFKHRADRWRVRCQCGAHANLGELRREYLKHHKKE